MDTTKMLVHRNLGFKPLACLLLPLAIGDVTCGFVMAATLPVTNCNDAGSGSLRAALALAHNGDSVDLTALACGTISLATGALEVAVDDLTLQGPGAGKLTIEGSPVDHSDRVIDHVGRGTLRIDALRITDSHWVYAYAAGGCVLSQGTVSLDRSTVTECREGGVIANGFSARDSTISNNSYRGVLTIGGSVAINSSTISGNHGFECVGLQVGIQNFTPQYPPLTPPTTLISNSTISGNYSTYSQNDVRGGAGCIFQSVTISNSTFAFNRANNRARSIAGLYIFATEATIESSIFARNEGPDLVFSKIGAVAQTFDGHKNLVMATASKLPADTIRTDPMLQALADNGGPNQTHALAPGSPAIDAGSNSAGLTSDQRGSPFTRIAGAGPDIGAFESQPVPPASVAIGPGFTGSWFDSAQSGHGLMLEILSDNRMLAMWFAFNPEGSQQSWFGGVGTYSGATATIIDVARPTGGRWIPNFDANNIVRSPWGTLTFTFTDCNHGRVDFNSGLGYGSGSMNLLRLTQPAGLACL
jgi:hypothetical protein